MSIFDHDPIDCVRIIREKNDAIRAVLHLLDAPAGDDQARKTGPLRGVPYVLKDVWDTGGIQTTGGSWRHRRRVPTTSSRVYDALRSTGAVLLGKSNVCDLAFCHESDNHLIGSTCNPFDKERTAGGSTGGGAAAVATGMAAFDWGTDIGGSIRLPAAFCGIAGLRLSSEVWRVDLDHFPRVPEFFWPMLGMGPLARTVADCRTIMNAMRSIREPYGERTMNGSVVVLPPDNATMGDFASFEQDVAAALVRAGRSVDIASDLPSPSFLNELFNAYMGAHFDEFMASGELPIRDGISAVALALATGGRLDRRVHPNTALLFAMLAAGHVTVYRDAKRIDEQVDMVRARIHAIWDQGKLIVTPASTLPAPKHGRAALTYSLATFAKIGNLIDGTSMTVPFGQFDGGLPRSVQVLGPPGAENAVLDLAEQLERTASVGSSSRPQRRFSLPPLASLMRMGALRTDAERSDKPRN